MEHVYVYSIMLRKSWFWFFSSKRTLRKVKGHYMSQDLPGFVLVVVLLDDTKIFVNMERYDTVELSKEYHNKIANQVKTETNGKTDLTQK